MCGLCRSSKIDVMVKFSETVFYAFHERFMLPKLLSTQSVDVILSCNFKNFFRVILSLLHSWICHTWLQISSDELVGAMPGSSSSVELWFMPLHFGRNGSKSTRLLKKTREIKLKIEDNCPAVITKTRKWAQVSRALQLNKVMAIINPVSGQGQARKKFESVLEPILLSAGMNVEFFVTKHQGHATELVLNSMPGEFDMIITLGGDGTTNEVLQGIFRRDDWEKMSQIPLLQVPCGSGNALAASVGMWDVLTAAYTAVKGITEQMDIISIIQSGCPRKFSFLSLTYGLISNLDVGTETIRWMGDLRFTLGAIYQILKQKTFKVSIGFVEDLDDAKDRKFYGHDGFIGRDGHWVEDLRGSNDVKGKTSIDDGFDSNQENISDYDSIVGAKELQKGCKGSMSPGPPLKYAKQMHSLIYGPPTSSLIQDEPISERYPRKRENQNHHPFVKDCSDLEPSIELPVGWLNLESQHVQLFAICNLPRLDMNFHFSPKSKICSGHLNMIYTTGRAGRIKGLQILSQSETGQHLENPLIMHRKIKAVFIHPHKENEGMLSKITLGNFFSLVLFFFNFRFNFVFANILDVATTWLEVDGEVVPLKPLFAEVHQGLCRILVPAARTVL